MRYRPVADCQGPLTEELVFRSTILAASMLGGLSLKSLVFGTPLWFGIGTIPITGHENELMLKHMLITHGTCSRRMGETRRQLSKL